MTSSRIQIRPVAELLSKSIVASISLITVSIPRVMVARLTCGMVSENHRVRNKKKKTLYETQRQCRNFPLCLLSFVSVHFLLCVILVELLKHDIDQTTHLHCLEREFFNFNQSLAWLSAFLIERMSFDTSEILLRCDAKGVIVHGSIHHKRYCPLSLQNDMMSHDWFSHPVTKQTTSTCGTGSSKLKRKSSLRFPPFVMDVWQDQKYQGAQADFVDVPDVVRVLFREVERETTYMYSDKTYCETRFTVTCNTTSLDEFPRGMSWSEACVVENDARDLHMHVSFPHRLCLSYSPNCIESLMKADVNTTHEIKTFVVSVFVCLCVCVSG